MIVPRANWAATAGSVAWANVTGKPSNFGGVTDIGQLTGAGFANKQVPIWSSALRKFVPANIGGIAGYVAPTPGSGSQYVDPVQVSWDVPSLLPLQSAYEDFPYIGATPGTPAAVGVPFDLQFCFPFAAVILNDSVRVMIVNMNSSPVDLGTGIWNIQIFKLA